MAITWGRPEPPKEPALMLTSAEVCHLCAIGIRTLWRLVARKQFPQPIRYTRKLVRWRRADVEKHLESAGTPIDSGIVVPYNTSVKGNHTTGTDR